MRSALLVALIAIQDASRAEKAADAITFPSKTAVAEWTAKGDEHRRVLDAVLKKEHWVSALKSIEERLGPMGSWKVEVKLLSWEGSHPADGGRESDRGWVSFNMRRLGEYERKLAEWRVQAEELRKQGKRQVGWKVPPIRYERLIWHELTHVFQGEVTTPTWFHEGLASWMGDDPSYVLAHLHNKRPVADLDAKLEEHDDAYGRGQRFFQWLESKAGRNGIKAVSKAVYAAKGDWKKALCDAAGLDWEALKKAELEWAGAYAKKHGPR
jgi:hypothetical protein